METQSRTAFWAATCLPQLRAGSAPRSRQHLGDGGSRHGRSIGSDLGGEPIPGSLLDQDIDQRHPLVVVGRIGQQLSVPMIVERNILLTHATPPRPYVTILKLFRNSREAARGGWSYQPLRDANGNAATLAAKRRRDCTGAHRTATSCRRPIRDTAAGRRCARAASP